MSYLFALTNLTMETFSRQTFSDAGGDLPSSIAPFATVSPAGSGTVTYAGLSGSVTLMWGTPLLPPSAVAFRGYASSESDDGTTWRCTITLQPQPEPDPPPPAPPPPVVLPPVTVAPNNPNLINGVDPDEVRDKIVQSARAEARTWKTTTDDAGQVALRIKYTAVTDGNPVDLKRRFENHIADSHTPQWCGIFGTWNVDQGRGHDGVMWRMGPGPAPPRDVAARGATPAHAFGGVLQCTDLAKLHKGDVAHVREPADKVKALEDWNKKHPVAQAAVKAAHPDWSAEAVETQVVKDIGHQPVLPNHHVLVVDPAKEPIPTVEGNAGGNFDATHSLVVKSERARSTLSFFYCAVPAKQCADEAKLKPNPGHPSLCPVANGAPCRLPDRQPPPPEE